MSSENLTRHSSVRSQSSHIQSRMSTVSKTDHTRSNTQSTQSRVEFFSPQQAFYSPTTPTPSSMEFLSNKAFLNAGFNVVEQGMRDISSKTVNVLPNKMKKALSSVKYYFAVDQNYVINKLCLLMFPFRSRNWSLGYSADEPVPPQIDTNAPDFYIPLMSAITYVLLSGVVLGLHERFTPEQLGMHATSVLIWNLIEICVLSFTFYLFNIQSKLRILDLIAYCGYKYVGMIAALIFYLLTNSLLAYRVALIYVSIAIAYFLVKCLRLQILPETGGAQSHAMHGNTCRIYLLLLIVLLQPFFIWYLTRHLIIS